MEIKSVFEVLCVFLQIVIYRPNGGLGAAPGESPVPLPEEGADLIYSYENLPSKYWTKYKAAARLEGLHSLHHQTNST